uniref:Rad21_Rec8 domain-containing protein n=1 Tax=Trichobilharzia regenti TaxID=157069 RepID=A0AA85KB94_TRIRE|nr:unnamed protein product [Trichobilharzia regenti]
MFYSIDLLSAHRGRFGVIWLAATRVRKQLTRRELNSVNIVTACNEITSHILGKTKIRLSLYLASQLTFGLCVIYREKVVFMLRDLQELSQRACVLTVRSIDLPTCDRRESHTRRRRTSVAEAPELPMWNNNDDINEFGNLQLPDLVWPEIEASLEFMDTQTLYQARREDITLVEDPLDTIPYKPPDDDLIPLDFAHLTELFKHSQSSIYGDDFPVTSSTRKHLLSESATSLAECSTVKRSRHLDESERFTTPANLETIEEVQLPVATECQTLPEAAELVNIPQVSDNVETVTEAIVENVPAVQITAMPVDLDEVQLPPVSTSTEVRIDSCLLENVQETSVTVERFELSSGRERQPSGNNTVEQQPTEVQQAFPPFHLSPLPPPPTNKVIRNRRKMRRKFPRGLIIDEATTLSSAEMKYNMEHGEETMRSRGELLAEPSRRCQFKYLVSRDVNRLFSMPGRLEVMQCSALAELWRQRLHYCEQAVKQGRLHEEDRISHNTDDLFQLNQPTIRPSSRMASIAEENESSVEIQRLARDTSSVHRAESLLSGGAGNTLIDVTTTNQPASVRESLVNLNDPAQSTAAVVAEGGDGGGGATDQVTTRTHPKLNINAISQSTPQQTIVQSLSHHFESTTMLGPVLEEREEQIQMNENELIPPVPVSTEFPLEPEIPAAAPPAPPPSQVLPSPPKERENAFDKKSQIWEYLRDRLASPDWESVSIEELCPPGVSSKKEAAFVFMKLLELSKKRRITMTQNVAFGEIRIRLKE